MLHRSLGDELLLRIVMMENKKRRYDTQMQRLDEAMKDLTEAIGHFEDIRDRYVKRHGVKAYREDFSHRIQRNPHLDIKENVNESA